MQYSTLVLGLMATAATATPTLFERQMDCNDQANACRTAPEANQAFCSAQYAACLGYNPYVGAAVTGPVAPIYTGSPFNGSSNATVPCYYATEVVTAITTYCPSATIFTYNNGTPATYTATGPGTVTITNCPCTVTTSYTTKPTNIPVGPTTYPPGASSPPTVVYPSTGGASPPPAGTATSVYTPPVVTSTQACPSCTPFPGAANVQKPALGLLALGVLALL
ncbi:hypothetical protein BP5796_10233 [Coleophoma crateriformis]|uniref:Uncharacterized protein n=1 Tax=Coleophoma crateriformis TaxID=565419 RepID=A0A3D8QV30_9HELO|nr:hypothetical protein BP5796_10233 [Coleophoma crateriformis]